MLNFNFRHFERAAEGRRDQIRISNFERDFGELVTCLHRIRTGGPFEQIGGMGCSRGPLPHPTCHRPSSIRNIQPGHCAATVQPRGSRATEPAPHASRMLAACSPHARRMLAACSPHARRMLAACSPHARRMLPVRWPTDGARPLGLDRHLMIGSRGTGLSFKGSASPSLARAVRAAHGFRGGSGRARPGARSPRMTGSSGRGLGGGRPGLGDRAEAPQANGAPRRGPRRQAQWPGARMLRPVRGHV
jgi:hypothetical protein